MIKLPFYDEIKIEKKDLESLRDIIHNSKKSKIPTYFYIKHLEEAVQTKFIFLFFEIVKEHNFNLYFPYPIYIVSSTEESFGDKSILFKNKKRTSYFFQKRPSKTSSERAQFSKKNFA